VTPASAGRDTGDGPYADRRAEALAALPATFRPVATRVVLLTLAVAVLVVLSTVAVLMPHDGAAPWSTAERITVVGTAVLFCAVLTALSRPRVVADAEGVTVVNVTARRRLAWAEILRVNLGHGDAWVRLDLADGTTLVVMGIQPGIARGQALRDARALRSLASALGEAH
jgi:hypothetical protein